VILSTSPRERLYVNGVDASTGDYLVPLGYLTPEQLVPVAKAEDSDLTPAQIIDLQEKALPVSTYAIRPGHDARKLGDAGWGVIWGPDIGQDVKDALKPLLDLRRGQAGGRYCEYPSPQHPLGFQPGEEGLEFLSKNDVLPGPADPVKMPYYLLIVGSPKTIPFSFQHQVDVDRAVGRLHFATAEEYAVYAQSVVAAQPTLAAQPASNVGAVQPAAPRARRTTFFSVQNPDDESTRLSHELLMKELYGRLSNDAVLAGQWAFDFVPPEQAKKPKLAKVLGGASTPALLFTASHGAGFGQWDLATQQARQGALVCGEWPGPVTWKKQGGGKIPEGYYFWAGDVASDARVAGLIAVFFACYGAGTPDLNDFVHRRDLNLAENTAVATEPFVSGLARRLLAHPNGGALAVVGHVDRAWDTGFTKVLWEPAPGAKERKASAPDAFEDLLRSLLKGEPVGLAMESMNMRYSSLSTILTSEFDQARRLNRPVIPAKVAPIWTANNDARNYVIIGDPAVTVPAFGQGE
jgi:hypothetical protein